jgi:hypothetical protein
MKSFVAAIPILLALALPARAADVQFKENGGQTTEISGLFADPDCSPMKLRGKIVKRNFNENGVTITGFVIEAQNGSRTFVNVDIPDRLDMVTLDYVTHGLQTLLLEGRYAHVGVRACGVSGGVLSLESVK